MLVDLFGDLQTDGPRIRTLGMYQPFATLMLHGKIETRWVLEGRKPPFPLGRYLIYSTKKEIDPLALLDWTGSRQSIANIQKKILHDPSAKLRGYAIAVGELVHVAPLLRHEAEQGYVKFLGTKVDNIGTKIQYGLHFKDMKRIDPFGWEFGAQGIQWVPSSQIEKIKIII